MKFAIGLLMMASLFIGLFIYVMDFHGLMATIKAFLFAIEFTVFIGIATWLMIGADKNKKEE